MLLGIALGGLMLEVQKTHFFILCPSFIIRLPHTFLSFRKQISMQNKIYN